MDGIEPWPHSASERAVVRGCQDDIRQHQRDWLIFSERFALGARRVMLDGVFRGLQALRGSWRGQRHDTSGNMPHRVVNVVWQWVLSNMSLHGPQHAAPGDEVRSAQSRCANALGAYDWVRAFGPPIASYYLESSERRCVRQRACRGEEDPTLRHSFCPAECITADCRELMHSRWHLREDAIQRCYQMRYASQHDTFFAGRTRLVGDTRENHAAYRSAAVYDGFHAGRTSIHRPRDAACTLNVSDFA